MGSRWLSKSGSLVGCRVGFRLYSVAGLHVQRTVWFYLPLVSREWKNGSNRRYNYTPSLKPKVSLQTGRIFSLFRLLEATSTSETHEVGPGKP